MARRSRIVGVPRLRRKLRRIDVELRPEIGNAIQATAEKLLADMKARVPVSAVPRHPHHLRDLLEMRVRKDELSGRVGLVRPTTERAGYYWRWVAYGTVKMPARDYITPALLRAEQEWPASIRAAVNKALRRVIQSEPVEPGGE